RYGVTEEKRVQDVVKDGVDIVSFSGDKLLGGPQAGIIVGKKKYIKRIKENPLTRALRLDKMTIGLLSETFRKYLNKEKAVKSNVVLKMISMSKAKVKKRADALMKELSSLKKRGVTISLLEDYSCVGGGALPEERIETYAISIKTKKYSSSELKKRFRGYKVPIIVRVKRDQLLLDMRTILPGEERVILEAFKEII
ncbi:aminotransferase class V-fold PLP-dependent enzyme, partial [Thermodesulfobacteriota bacterium]